MSAEFGRTWRTFGRSRPKCGQHPPDCDRFRASLGRMQLSLGQTRPEFGRFQHFGTIFGQARPHLLDSGRILPNLADVGRSWTDVGDRVSRSDRGRARRRETGDGARGRSLGNTGTPAQEVRPEVGAHGSASGRRSLVPQWYCSGTAHVYCTGNCTGTALLLCWHCSRSALVLCWRRASTIHWCQYSISAVPL